MRAACGQLDRQFVLNLIRAGVHALALQATENVLRAMTPEQTVKEFERLAQQAGCIESEQIEPQTAVEFDHPTSWPRNTYCPNRNTY